MIHYTILKLSKYEMYSTSLHFYMLTITANANIYSFIIRVGLCINMHLPSLDLVQPKHEFQTSRQPWGNNIMLRKFRFGDLFVAKIKGSRIIPNCTVVLNTNIDLKPWNKLHWPMHRKIGDTWRVYNGHMFYTLL